MGKDEVNQVVFALFGQRRAKDELRNRRGRLQL